MQKFVQWMKTHKPQTAAIAVVIIIAIAAAVAAGIGLFSAQPQAGGESSAPEASASPSAEPEAKEVEVALEITADDGWSEKAMPAIVHIKGADKANADVDFYHAIMPDADGNRGASSVKLKAGKYTVTFISPIVRDGDDYAVYETGDAKEITVDASGALSVDCAMERVPADKVTDEMLQALEEQIRNAVEKGDESLQGENGEAILGALEPAAESSKPQATKAPEKDDGKAESSRASEADNTQESSAGGSQSGGTGTSGGSNSGSSNSGSQSGGSSGSTGGSTGGGADEPSQPAHVHQWKDHTATREVWVENLVEVPDYEIQQIPVGTTYIFAYDGYTTSDINAAKEHAKELLRAGVPDNYRMETIYEEQQVQVGSHQEDQGWYETETYVDYQYCDCGAIR